MMASKVFCCFALVLTYRESPGMGFCFKVKGLEVVGKLQVALLLNEVDFWFMFPMKVGCRLLLIMN